MKKRILLVMYAVLVIILLKQAVAVVGNRILMSDARRGKYHEIMAEMLIPLSFPEKYKAYYNAGNILYQEGDFENAALQYNRALQEKVPAYQECDIRVNCALAMCHLVEVDEEDEESVEAAIATYLDAIEVLVEEGCAGRGDSIGHDADAEQLKQDIQDEINRLKKLSSSSEEDEEEKSSNAEKQESVEQKIQDIKEKATKTQREYEAGFEIFEKSNLLFSEDNQGKRW